MKRTLCVLALTTLAVAALAAGDPPFHPDIPKAWDEKAVEGFELPLAQRDRTPRYMTSEQYYALQARPIYRSYPVYAKGREPAGYIESLKQKEPEIIFDPAKLHTKQDWIAAGKLVFDYDIRFFPVTADPPSAEQVKLPNSVSQEGVLLPSNGSFRYYIRKKGVLERGINACAGCHTTRMPDGSYLEGGQGDIDGPSLASEATIRAMTPEAYKKRMDTLWLFFGAPWVKSKDDFLKTMTVDQYVRESAAAHAGVFGRQGTSESHPPRVPSLIGIADIKYLDATGLVRNRGIGDIMRYAIVNQGLDTLAYYGDFQPAPGATPFSGEEGTRYSDEQLYALALYIQSLKPPPNPNPVDEHARHGQQIFTTQGCPVCHTPPLYTNNKLNPVRGFKVPDDLRKTGDIMSTSIGTDPVLALETRRGTGFYKVPSLRGLWYRHAFGHTGQAASLEEWFDPARLEDGYNAKGFHMGPAPIEGHEKGLDLTPQEKHDLIAFLKTL